MLKAVAIEDKLCLLAADHEIIAAHEVELSKDIVVGSVHSIKYVLDIIVEIVILYYFFDLF